MPSTERKRDSRRVTKGDAKSSVEPLLSRLALSANLCAYLGGICPKRLQNASCNTLTLAKQTQQYVLRTNIVVTWMIFTR